MRMLRFAKPLAGLALLALSLPATAASQERTVLSKEISVGRSEASMRLEFSSGSPLEIALRDGSVYVDGEATGAYTAGDGLDTAWRSLLGEAVSLDDGALARRLRDWSPPSDLSGDRLELAQTIDHSLEDALAAPEAPAKPSVDVSMSGDDGALVRALLGQTDRLAVLGQALDGIGSNMKLHVGEDVTVAKGETLEGSLVVVQGDVRIEGDVTGDVVVVDGTLEMADGGHVEGDVRLADATLTRDGGSIDGDVVNVERTERDLEREIRARVRTELRDEIRNEVRANTRRNTGGSFFNPFRNIFRGVGGLIENLVSILVLGLIGMGVVSFAPRNLEVVAETARRAPGRAAMVGLAGMFMLIPVWVVGAIVLTVSIVGIPVMIAWLPLFPLAAVAAAVLGYLAVARNVGEWLADSGYRYTDWIRKTNALHLVVGGIAGLSLFFVAANVLRMVPFFGFFRGLLVFGGVLASMATVLIGFGSVLLTRAGRRPEYGPMDFDAAWERTVEMDPDLEDMESEPAASGPANDASSDAPGGKDA